MFRFLAFGVAPVTIVQPLISLSVIFRMIFGFFINRSHERFDRQIIMGIILSFIGAVILSLSAEAVQNLLNLPIWLENVVKWEWP